MLAEHSKGDITRALALYNRGADITAVDNAGNNTLHYLVAEQCGGHAAEEEYRRTVSTFVRKAPELLHQTNKEGKTALHIARSTEQKWCLEAIRDAVVEIEGAQAQ